MGKPDRRQALARLLMITDETFIKLYSSLIKSFSNKYKGNGACTQHKFTSTSMCYDTLSDLTIMCRVTKKEKKD